MSKASESWQQALLQEGATLHDAIRTLNRTGLGIALVVDRGGVLLGTITDGDIRRGLLRGFLIEDSIVSIVNSKPLVAPPGLDRQAALGIIRTNDIEQLPIIDQHGYVIGLHLAAELIEPECSNTMVVMVGGLGTRLRPRTENCPKPMLEVSGKPMLEHIIERAKTEGINHFYLAINYLGHIIENYFCDGSRWNVKIEYLRETSPLGTAGALSLIKKRPEEPLFVTNGDVLTEVRLSELLKFHHRHKSAATMAVRQYEWKHPFGVVRTKDQDVDIVGFEEKPIFRTHINAGVYVLNPESLEFMIPGQVCDMPSVFNTLREKGLRTIVYPIHEPWLDVGRPEDYEMANRGP